MENSFYYFFSATPQVLGSILALFGVFVIYKVQSLKSRLLGIGDAVIMKVEDKINISEIIDGDDKRVTIEKIKTYIEKGDVDDLYLIMEKLTNIQVTNFKVSYDFIYFFLNKLINKTLKASIFTAAVVLISLLLIPFGNYFLNHSIYLYILFPCMIVAIGLCLYFYIEILLMSLKLAI